MNIYFTEAIVKLKLQPLGRILFQVLGSLSGRPYQQPILALMRLKLCSLHFTVAYWRGIQPNHKAVPAIQKIVRNYVTIICPHQSLIQGIIHLEGSGKTRHECSPSSMIFFGNEWFKYLLESSGNGKYLRSLDVTVKIISSIHWH